MFVSIQEHWTHSSDWLPTKSPETTRSKEYGYLEKLSLSLSMPDIYRKHIRKASLLPAMLYHHRNVGIETLLASAS
jgi:hypothetical protein